jgi:hypothetical protein
MRAAAIDGGLRSAFSVLVWPMLAAGRKIELLTG